MDKRGQFGADNTNMLQIFGAIILVILVVLAIGYAISNTSSKVNSAIAQIPSDVSAIATACKSFADSGVALLSSPYCLDAREATLGTGVFGTGIFAKKQVVNCPYAKEKDWFKVNPDKNPPVCESTNEWAKKYCESLKATQGVKFKDEIVVNGKPCYSTSGDNWNIRNEAKLQASIDNGLKTPQVKPTLPDDSSGPKTLPA